MARLGWFRDRGQLDEAVRHAVQAGEGLPAAELVEQLRPAALCARRASVLISLLRQLPAEQVERSFMLRCGWRGRSSTSASSRPVCRAWSVSSRSSPRAMPASAFTSPCCGPRCACSATTPTARGAAAAAGERSAGAKHPSWLTCTRASTRRPAASSSMRPSCWSRACSRRLGRGQPQGRCLMGLSHALEGQMTHAERIYRAVAAEAEQGARPASTPTTSRSPCSATCSTSSTTRSSSARAARKQGGRAGAHRHSRRGAAGPAAAVGRALAGRQPAGVLRLPGAAGGLRPQHGWTACSPTPSPTPCTGASCWAR